MTTAHDTAATLEAAIDAHGANASGARAALHRAITAHVEAEVARRLAPNLELWRWKCHDETIEQAIERLVRERNEYAEKLCERNAALVMAPDVEAAIAQIVACTDLMDNAGSARAREAIRASIAADKARAVEAAEDAAFIRGRDAVRKYPDGWGLVARPTTKEAWGLVDALSDAAYDVGVAAALHADDGWRESVRKRRATARTALLRALGVES